MVRSRTNLNMQVGRPCLELCAGLLVLVKPAGREPRAQGRERAEEREINSEPWKVHGGEVACEQGLY